MDIEIKLSDFTKTPMGRFISDSETSGEAFRERILLPELRKHNQKIIINLDGVSIAIGSSFLEESIGGLIRLKGYTKEQVLHRITIKSSNDLYKILINKYIDKAESIRLNKMSGN